VAESHLNGAAWPVNDAKSWITVPSHWVSMATKVRVCMHGLAAKVSTICMSEALHQNPVTVFETSCTA
jgi:hypothetical protein